MAYNHFVVGSKPLWLDAVTYDAKNDRRWFSDIASEGVLGSGDFAVTVTPATMTLNIAAGKAWVTGSNVTEQGMYRIYEAAGGSITVPAASGAAPRIDTVILRVFDNASDASGINDAYVEIIPGTATAGASLANLTGIANLTTLTDASKSVTVLAYILVPQSAASLTNTATNVLDARVLSKIGSGNIGLSSVKTPVWYDTEFVHQTAAKVDITQGGLVVPAGAIGVSGYARFRSGGDMSINNATGGNRIVTWEIKLGSQVLWAAPTLQMIQDAANRVWHIDLLIKNGYRGVANNQRAIGRISIGPYSVTATTGTGGFDKADGGGYEYFANILSAITTVDLTAASLLTVNVTLVTGSSNQVRHEESFLECYTS